ncbi:MAG: hypothetical protein ACEPOV_01475 [Hyphomicrobiales bacterium]
MKKLLLIITILSIPFYYSCRKSPSIIEENVPAKHDSSFPIENENEQMVTLAAMSYVGIDDNSTILDSLRIVLSNRDYITGGDWELAFYSYHKVKSLLTFVVKSKKYSNTYAVVQRGTNFGSVFNILYDIDVFRTEDWSYTLFNVGDPKIAKGVSNVLRESLNTKGDAYLPFTGRMNLDDYLKQLITYENIEEEFFNIYFAGHSLGGASTIAVSSYFIYNILSTIDDPRLNVGIYTYAAPTLGNKDFVTYYNTLVDMYPPSTGNVSINSKRFYNKSDFVPVCLYEDVTKAANLGYPLSFLFRTFIFSTVSVFDKGLKDRGIHYFHVGTEEDGTSNSVSFDKLPKPDFPIPCNSLGDYAIYTGFYHNHNHYSVALGGNAIP